jgi:hypothetical protein
MGEFEISRKTVVAAPRERVRALIEDFRQWRQWSPWEEVDPELKREYSGAETGVGARYAWEGNRKAGKGNMQIAGATADRVELDLNFEKPWKASNKVYFELTPSGEDTEVQWRMTGHNKGFAAVFAKVMPMDRMVGKDMEKGLARMKAAAEAPTPPSS